MSYEELLSGMLFPGEALQFIPPARIKAFRKLEHGGRVLEEKQDLRCFFTDKRLFFINTRFAQQPSCSYAKTRGQPLTRNRVKLGCELEDNMYWTAVNLEKVHAQTSASLSADRPEQWLKRWCCWTQLTANTKVNRPVVVRLSCSHTPSCVMRSEHWHNGGGAASKVGRCAAWAGVARGTGDGFRTGGECG